MKVQVYDPYWDWLINIFDWLSKPDNQTDIGPALMKAFECAKASVTARSSDTVILVPAGVFSKS